MPFALMQLLSVPVPCFEHPLNPDLFGRVNEDDTVTPLVQPRFEQKRSINHNSPLRVGRPALSATGTFGLYRRDYPSADLRMNDGFEPAHFFDVREHHLSQLLSIELTFVIQHASSPVGNHLGDDLIATEHVVADPVGVEHLCTQFA